MNSMIVSNPIPTQSTALSKRQRIKGLVLTKGIVVGSVAWALQKPRDQKTHTWICYVRGAQNEDLSPIIRRVEFTLHPTFDPMRRGVDAPGPFTCQESGWGEFTLTITLFFAEELERPVSLAHTLKLFDAQHPANAPPQAPDTQITPVVSEHFEEIVFTDPTEELRQRLAQKLHRAPNPPHEIASLMGPVLNKGLEAFSDAEDLRAIALANANVCGTLKELTARCAELEAAERALKDQLEAIKKQSQAQPMVQ